MGVTQREKRKKEERCCGCLDHSRLEVFRPVCAPTQNVSLYETLGERSTTRPDQACLARRWKAGTTQHDGTKKEEETEMHAQASSRATEVGVCGQGRTSGFAVSIGRALYLRRELRQGNQRGRVHRSRRRQVVPSTGTSTIFGVVIGTAMVSAQSKGLRFLSIVSETKSRQQDARET